MIDQPRPRYRLRSTLIAPRGITAFLLSVQPLKARSLEHAILEADARDWSGPGVKPDEIAIIDDRGTALARRPYRRPGPVQTLGRTDPSPVP
jgi:hypothetical protein